MDSFLRAIDLTSLQGLPWQSLWMWVVAIASLLGLLFLLVTGRARREDDRLSELASGVSRSSSGELPANVPKMAAFSAAGQQLREQEKKDKLRERMVQAGLYRKSALPFFVAARIILFFVPLAIGLAAGWLGVLPLWQGAGLGGLLSLVGTLAPSFWLDYVKAKRQTQLRRALPDALDVIVVCLEGGLSLSGSLSRVAHELAGAHPMLAQELSIVEREIQMGRTTGDAMRQFARRFDLEELRSMASVISQAEKFGTSVVKALEVYAETLRWRRRQRAEEMAQKAIIKILFPTLIFIFPGIFVVLLGPAIIQVMDAFSRAQRQ